MKIKVPALILGVFVLQFIGLAGGLNLKPPCETKIPLLRGDDRKPVWLKTPQLVERVSYCEAPIFPPLFRTARVEGTVILSILVDEKGDVACIKYVAGGQFLVSLSFDAARKWKFKPMTQDGKAVGFYGVLEFRFSTTHSDPKSKSCLDAHF